MRFIFKKNKLLLIASISMSCLLSIVSVGAAKILEIILDVVTTQN